MSIISLAAQTNQHASAAGLSSSETKLRQLKDQNKKWLEVQHEQFLTIVNSI